MERVHEFTADSQRCGQTTAPYGYYHLHEDEQLSHLNQWPLSLPSVQASGHSLRNAHFSAGPGSPPSCSGTEMHLSRPFQLLRQDSAELRSPTMADMEGLYRFLPRNTEEELEPVDIYSSTNFQMFEFKVRRCMRSRSHDWTECPFAHPGEKARRRDPRRFNYAGTPCPDYRKGSCRRGDACEFAHGVFECWLHPARYRTQPCKDGRNCKRRICFFAHTEEQLRLLPTAASAAKSMQFTCHPQLASPTSALSPPRSPDFSPQQPSSPNCLHSPPSWSPSRGIPSPGYGAPAMSHSSSPAHVSHLASGTGRQLERYKSMPALSASQESAARSAAAAVAQARRMAVLQEAAAQVPPGEIAHGRNVAGPPNGSGGMEAGSRAAMISSLIASLQAMELQPSSGDAGPTVTPQWLQMQAHVQAQQEAQAQVRVGAQLAVQQQLQQCHLLQQRSLLPSRGPMRRLQSAVSLPADIKWLREAEEEERMVAGVERIESGRDLRAEIYGKMAAEWGSESGDSGPDFSWVGDLVTENPVPAKGTW